MNIKPFKDIVTTALPTEKVFMYQMPDTIKRGILVIHQLNGAELRPDLPDYKKARFQTIVRERDFQSGYDLAKQVMAALKVARVAAGPLFIHFVNPLHDPVAFPKSDGGFIEFSVNYETAYVEH